jgi:hypothetical protein
MVFECKFCGKRVKTQRGLRQHIDGKPDCRRQEKECLGIISLPMIRKKLRSDPIHLKRSYENTYLGDDLSTCNNDSLPILPKAKSMRGFCDLDVGDTSSKGKKNTAILKTMMEGLSDKTLGRLLEKCASTAGFSASAQEMCSEQEEFVEAALELSSEDE